MASGLYFSGSSLIAEASRVSHGLMRVIKARCRGRIPRTVNHCLRYTMEKRSSCWGTRGKATQSFVDPRTPGAGEKSGGGGEKVDVENLLKTVTVSAWCTYISMIPLPPHPPANWYHIIGHRVGGLNDRTSDSILMHARYFYGAFDMATGNATREEKRERERERGWKTRST